MTFTVQVRPDVEEDALAGYAWYEAKAEGLGEEFLAALYAGIQNIQSNPRCTETSTVRSVVLYCVDFRTRFILSLMTKHI